jgi:hypothetical protein
MGLLRDVCVLGTDVSVWERLMAAVPGVPGEYGFSVDGEPVALADFSVRRFFAEDPRESSPQLDLRLGELRFACFFFEPTEIEFSFGPEDLEGGWYLAAWPTRQQHCGNIQVLTGPTGYPEWVSEVEPGSTHDITARSRTRTARAVPGRRLGPADPDRQGLHRRRHRHRHRHHGPNEGPQPEPRQTRPATP